MSSAVRSHIHATQVQRLDLRGQLIGMSLAQRVQTDEQLLLSVAGLFETKSPVTHADFNHYVATLRIDQRYPGIKSVLFAPLVPAPAIQNAISSVRSGNPPLAHSSVHPTGPPKPDPQPVGTPVLYIAPLTPDNQRLLGTDPIQDPANDRLALNAAPGARGPVWTDRSFTDSEAAGDNRVGFICYLPVVIDGRFVGWVGAEFRSEPFFSPLIGNMSLGLTMEVHDSAGQLLYSSDGVTRDGAPLPLATAQRPDTDMQSSTTLTATGWRLHYFASNGFVPESEKIAPWLVGIVGCLAALLYLSTATISASWRHRAIDLERRASEVGHQATHDALTGLPNRVLFMSSLTELIDNGTPFALAYLDIDRFKPVNDEHGHNVGDALLVAMSQRMRSHTRATDMVARIGGDEFGIILSDPSHAERIVADVVNHVGHTYLLCNDDSAVTVAVSASVGIAIHPGDGNTARCLIHAADVAMFTAKRSGDGQFRYASEVS